MFENENFAVLIPARFQSSRFPGKPLADICGLPMIQHVWERCCEAVGENKVYIATDDKRISEVVEGFGGKFVMTSSSCLTGTDRLAEANLRLGCDFVINVQGDEPMIDPNDICAVIEQYLEKPGQVVNAMCKILDRNEFDSLTVPKVVVDRNNTLLYMSRAGIPLSKTGEFKFAYKQVCIYAFSKSHLELFSSFSEKSDLEEVEDIEILRFLEEGVQVKMVSVDGGTIAVDTPEDLERAITLMGASN